MQAEIDRRCLDTSAIHLSSEEEIEEKLAREADAIIFRIVVVGSGCAGLVIAYVAFAEMKMQTMMAGQRNTSSSTRSDGSV